MQEGEGWLTIKILSDLLLTNQIQAMQRKQCYELFSQYVLTADKELLLPIPQILAAAFIYIKVVGGEPEYLDNHYLKDVLSYEGSTKSDRLKAIQGAAPYNIACALMPEGPWHSGEVSYFERMHQLINLLH
jgi:hypothetical protein